MTEEDVVKLLRERVGTQHGGRAAFARQAGINRAYITMVLGGKKPPGPAIIAALGLEKCPCVYREING